MKQNLTKEQLLNYLRTNKKYLNISAIAKETGISNLNNILNGNLDGHGTPHKLADKHINSLKKLIQSL